MFVNGPSEFDRQMEQLLKDQQEIIDAWYAQWLAEQRARAVSLFAKKRQQPCR